MTPFALLEKHAADNDSNGRAVARHGINAATTTAGLGAGGLSTLVARLMMAEDEVKKIKNGMGITRAAPGIGRFLTLGLQKTPKSKKMLAASLIPLLGAAGYGAGRGINAGIDKLAAEFGIGEHSDGFDHPDVTANAAQILQARLKQNALERA